MENVLMCTSLILAGISGCLSADVSVSLSNSSPEVGDSVEVVCSYNVTQNEVVKFLYVDRKREFDNSWQGMVSVNAATNQTDGLPLLSELSVTPSGGSITVQLAEVDCSATARYKCQLSLRGPSEDDPYTEMPMEVKDSDGKTVACSSQQITFSLGILVAMLAVSFLRL